MVERKKLCNIFKSQEYVLLKLDKILYRNILSQFEEQQKDKVNSETEKIVYETDLTRDSIWKFWNGEQQKDWIKTA